MLASLLNNNSDFIFKKKENEYNKKQDVSEMLSSKIDQNESENIISKLFHMNQNNNKIIDEKPSNQKEIDKIKNKIQFDINKKYLGCEY